jgi:hypothetical protein
MPLKILPPSAAGKKVELNQVVEESVALLGLVARLHHDLDQAGLGKAFSVGEQISVRHLDLMKDWADCIDCKPMTEKNAHLYNLYRRCRELINPVQSALQNLLRPRGEAIRLPETMGATSELNPAKVLAAIVKAKENWAYIDAHPQIVIARAGI